MSGHLSFFSSQQHRIHQSLTQKVNGSLGKDLVGAVHFSSGMFYYGRFANVKGYGLMPRYAQNAGAGTILEIQTGMIDRGECRIVQHVVTRRGGVWCILDGAIMSHLF
jgi:hypothetical protein